MAVMPAFSSPVVQSFFAGAKGALKNHALVTSGLAALVAEIVSDATRAWPEIHVDATRFARHMGEQVKADETIESYLRSIHGRDLFLAFACAENDRRALFQLEHHISQNLPLYLAKINNRASFSADVKQILLHKLFVAEGGSRPKILDYAGRGALGAWLRVAAIRTGQNLLRDKKRAGKRAEEAPVAAPKPDPELGYLKGHYTREFKEAFRETLLALSPRERNIIRLYFLDGLSSGQIAVMYKVSGAAVRLWIKQWREAMLAGTRKRLARKLRIKSAELDSIMVLVDSRLDVGVSQLLSSKT
jgi:RNA polymerase sigma-70 factor (ECF subfamily)